MLATIILIAFPVVGAALISWYFASRDPYNTYR